MQIKLVMGERDSKERQAVDQINEHNERNTIPNKRTTQNKSTAVTVGPAAARFILNIVLPLTLIPPSGHTVFFGDHSRPLFKYMLKHITFHHLPNALNTSLAPSLAPCLSRSPSLAAIAARSSLLSGLFLLLPLLPLAITIL